MLDPSREGLRGKKAQRLPMNNMWNFQSTLSGKVNQAFADFTCSKDALSPDTITPVGGDHWPYRPLLQLPISAIGQVPGQAWLAFKSSGSTQITTLPSVSSSREGSFNLTGPIAQRAEPHLSRLLLIKSEVTAPINQADPIHPLPVRATMPAQKPNDLQWAVSKPKATRIDPKKWELYKPTILKLIGDRKTNSQMRDILEERGFKVT